MKKINIIIPARFGSSRFPGKPLVKILGKELILRVADQCAKVFTKRNVYIATDDKRINDLCKKHNFKTIITPKNCKTGTDRIFFAAKEIGKSDFFINVQGDEPLVSALDIKKIIKAKKKFMNHVICGYSRINFKTANNLNIPKVVINKESNLLYMSRSLIPGSKKMHFKNQLSYLKQVCIYAYTFSELKEFNKFSGKSYNENLEDIEILRFLDLNRPIKMVEVSDGSVAVDVKKDIKKVIRILKKDG